jgi:hypothetical protein
MCVPYPVHSFNANKQRIKTMAHTVKANANDARKVKNGKRAKVAAYDARAIKNEVRQFVTR